MPNSRRKDRDRRSETDRPIPISAARSRIMKAIRAKGNSTTELALARTLRREGLSGWRRHLSLPGTPDFVWRERRVALFVDGCFWHGCPSCYRAPRHNPSFWADKVAGNRRRDQRVRKRLGALGWRVIRVWECQVGAQRTVSRIRRALSTSPKKTRIAENSR